MPVDPADQSTGDVGGKGAAWQRFDRRSPGRACSQGPQGPAGHPRLAKLCGSYEALECSHPGGLLAALTGRALLCG